MIWKDVQKEVYDKTTTFTAEPGKEHIQVAHGLVTDLSKEYPNWSSLHMSLVTKQYSDGSGTVRITLTDPTIEDSKEVDWKKLFRFVAWFVGVLITIFILVGPKLM